MSRRVTNKSNMTDKDLAVYAAELAHIEYSVSGETIFFRSGSLANASLNLSTGDVRGDTDFGHTEDTLGLLRSYYQEAQTRREFAKQGTVIDSREVQENGDIVLLWHTA
jgi:hypothetical protein